MIDENEEEYRHKLVVFVKLICETNYLNQAYCVRTQNLFTKLPYTHLVGKVTSCRQCY